MSTGNPIRFKEDLLNLDGQEEARKAAASVRALDKALAGLTKTLLENTPQAAVNIDHLYARIRSLTVEVQQVNIATREQRSSLSGLAGQVAQTTRAVREHEAAERGRQQTLELAKTSVAGLKQEINRLTAEYNRLDPALEADRAKMHALAGEIRALRTEADQLTKATRTTATAMSFAQGSYQALERETKQLIAQLKAMPEGFDSSSKAATELKAQIAANTEKLRAFDKEIGQNFRNVGNYAASIIEAVNALRQKKAALERDQQALQAGIRAQHALVVAQRGSNQAVEQARQRQNAYQAELNQTEAELRQVNIQLNQFNQYNTQNNTLLGRVTSSMESQVAQLAALYLSYQAVTRVATVFFDANLEYSDLGADVRKTAQLTAEEFENLANVLRQYDSRTTLAERLGIAKIGGQLGTAKDDLAGFVRAVDTSVQALGDDFQGGAEEIATSLGKIRTVFKAQLGGNLEEDLLNIGDALNQLGAEGAATAPQLADVALRAGAVAANAKLGLADVLAYAAVLEETGYSAETSGTALNRLFNTLSTRQEEAFKIAKLGDANLTLKQFRDLVNNDFQGALNAFLKGLNAGGTTTTRFNQLLATLKLNSGEAKSAITTLAKNLDLVADRQRIANEQLGDSSSLAAEATIKTGTLNASYIKLKDTLTNLATNGRVSNLLKALIDAGRFALNGFKPLEQAPADPRAAIAQLGDKALSTQAAAADVAKLVAEYDRLTASGRTSADAQEALQAVIGQLRVTLGASVTALDQETGRLRVNEEALRSAAKARQEEADAAATALAVKLKQYQQEEAQARALAKALNQAAEERRYQLQAGPGGVNPQKFYYGSSALAAQFDQLNKGPQAADNVERLAVNNGMTTAQLQGFVQYVKVSNEAAEASKRADAAGRQLQTVLAQLGRLHLSEADALALLNKRRAQGTKATEDEIEADRKLAAAELELEKFRLEQAAKVQERVATDPARSEADRTAAVQKAVTLRTQAEMKGMQAALLNDKLNTAQRTLLREQFQAKSADLIREGSKEELKLHKETLDQLGQLDQLRLQTENSQLERLRDNENLDAATRLAAAEEIRQNLIRLAEEQYQAEVRAAEGAANKIAQAAERKKKAEEEANAGIAGVGTGFKLDDAGKQTTAAALQLEQALSASVGSRLEIERDYQRERRRLEDEADQRALEILQRDPLRQQEAADKELEILRKKNQRKLEEEQAYQQALQQLITQGFATAETVASAFFQMSADRRQFETEALNAQKENELQLAGDNAKAKEQIEKTYAARALKLRQQQAKAEKAQALFSIALNTAQAIISTYAQVPKFDFGISATALAVLIGAAGAAQAAAVLSKPLPQYAKGVRGKAGDGLAIIGEQGPELYSQPTGDGGRRWQLSPDGPTLTHLKAGTDVYTATETERILASWQRSADTRTTIDTTAALRSGVRTVAQRDAEREAQGWRQMAAAYRAGTQSLERTIRGKQETHIVGDLRNGIAVVTREGQQFTTYLDRRLNRYGR